MDDLNFAPRRAMILERVEAKAQGRLMCNECARYVRVDDPVIMLRVEGIKDWLVFCCIHHEQNWLAVS